MKRILLLLAMLAMLAFLAAPALAQGPGDPEEHGPPHANSICSFSGLNDEPDDPEEGGRVQSYGQIVSQGGKAFAPSPGDYCNAHLYPYPPGPPPPPE